MHSDTKVYRRTHVHSVSPFEAGQLYLLIGDAQHTVAVNHLHRYDSDLYGQRHIESMCEHTWYHA